MKRAKIYLLLIFLGLFLGTNYSCEITPDNSCEQDEICPGKSVTACCSSTSCYYVYNGVEYGDDANSMAKLAVALGCTQGSAPTFKEDIDALILRLQALGDFARAQSMK